jgi:hypothetical protein
VDIRPSHKEPTVKTRLATIVLALAVALMAASGASAKKQLVHSNVHVAKHSLVKAAQKSAHMSVDRRSVRGGF